MRTVKADIAIAGAGVAGLWLANLLQNRGFDVAGSASPASVRRHPDPWRPRG